VKIIDDVVNLVEHISRAARPCIPLPLLVAALGTPCQAVDMTLESPDGFVCASDTVRINLVLSTANAPQTFDALDAIVTWDTNVLTLVGTDQAEADLPFFATGFLPDIDGVNDDIHDGDVLFTALVSPGQTAIAPIAPDRFVVTTFEFEVVGAGQPTIVALAPSLGAFAESRVLLTGAAITGSLEPATVFALPDPCPPCPWDCAPAPNGNGIVNIDDLLAVINAFGGPGGPCDNAPENGNGTFGNGIVNIDDLLGVINNFGPCP